MFPESEQWKKTIAAKTMNGFGGLCVFYLLIAFRKQNKSCKATSQELSQTKDLNHCKPRRLCQISISQMGLIALPLLKVI